VPGRDREVRVFHRHRVDLLQAQPPVLERALAQVREIAVGVCLGRDALVRLEYMHVLPWDVQASNGAQHDQGYGRR
jgi:hypothetical protein